MSIIKLQDGKQFDINYITDNDVTIDGNELLSIAVVTNDFNALETALGNNNAEKIDYGELHTVNGTEQFDITTSYEGYTQIVKMTKDRNFQLAPDKTGTVITVIMGKPDLRTDYEKSKDEIMLALTELYEMIPAK